MKAARRVVAGLIWLAFYALLIIVTINIVAPPG